MHEIFLFDLMTVKGLSHLFQYATVAQMLFVFVLVMFFLLTMLFLWLMRYASNDMEFGRETEKNLLRYLGNSFLNLMTVMMIALFLMAVS